MKKFVCLILALIMTIATMALAESTPSKTTGDLTQIEVSVENIPADSGFFMKPVVEADPVYQEKVEICQNEIVKLAESEKVEEYFSVVVDTQGNAVSLNEVLGTETLNVYEFCPVVAEQFEENYGAVKATLRFATPYEKGEKVVVLIGLVDTEAVEDTPIVWTAFDGDVVEQGCVEAEFDAATVLAIQEGNALMAIASR